MDGGRPERGARATGAGCEGLWPRLGTHRSNQ